MKLPPSLEAAIRKENGLLPMKRIAALGISRTSVSRYVKEGLLERISHGVYQKPGEVADTLFAMMFRNPTLIASHGTALWLVGLAETAPIRWTVTSSHDEEPSRSVRRSCQCFYVKRQVLEVGLELRKTPFGNEIRCYDAERTVCDLIRSRNRLDDELVVSGLRNWGGSPRRDPAKLARYATALGIFSRVRTAVEVLL